MGYNRCNPLKNEGKKNVGFPMVYYIYFDGLWVGRTREKVWRRARVQEPGFHEIGAEVAGDPFFFCWFSVSGGPFWFFVFVCDE